jgi:hypothetical protein
LNEETLYPLVAHWLRTQGYDPIIAGGQKQLSIPIVHLLPGKLFVEPDIVGLKDGSRLAAIEVKTDAKEIREGIGQCFIYTAAADDVYLALTEEVCREVRSTKLFESWRLGLLSLRKTKEVVDSFIDESGTMKLKPHQDPGDFELPTGWWHVDQKMAPGLNYNVDFAGLHQELLRQTKLALGRV